MPTLTRAFIKSGLIFLGAALLTGVLLASRPLLADRPSFALFQPVLAALQPTYLHLFMVGWVTQLILGVAYWMFPKASIPAIPVSPISATPVSPATATSAATPSARPATTPSPTSRDAVDRPGWAVFGMLNTGLLLRLVAEPWLALNGGGGPAPGILFTASALLQLAAGWTFVALIWPRVKGR